jgi:hypothetical protein
MSETQEVVMQKLQALIGEQKTSESGLQSRMSGIEQQIQDLTAALTATPKAQSGGSSDDVWPKRKTGGDTDIAALVAEAVTKAVAPITEELGVIKNDRVVSKVKEAQNASYNIAVQQFPDLKDPNSDLAKMAESLYQNRRDLAGLEDAPMVLASMAKGILADTRAVNEKVVQQKKDAAVTSPNPSTALNATMLSEDRDRATQARELKEKLVEKSHQEGIGTEGLADMFRLNLEQIRGEGQSE